jgi:hypothetical protein
VGNGCGVVASVIGGAADLARAALAWVMTCGAAATWATAGGAAARTRVVVAPAMTDRAVARVTMGGEAVEVFTVWCEGGVVAVESIADGFFYCDCQTPVASGAVEDASSDSIAARFCCPVSGLYWGQSKLITFLSYLYFNTNLTPSDRLIWGQSKLITFLSYLYFNTNLTPSDRLY